MLRGHRATLRRQYNAFREFVWRRTGGGRDNQHRLEQLRGRYAGRRCFIFGGGPSLKKTDVRLLKHEITIASNAIFLIFDEMGYLPTFLTVEDRLVAEDRAERLNHIRGTTKVFPRDLSYCLTRDAETVYLNFVRDYTRFPQFSEQFNKVVYFGGTVSFLNLQLAYYLGCNPIYLIGFDHNYRTPPDLTSHIIVSDAADVNHFHPDYFGKGLRWHDPQVDRMEASYEVAKRFLVERGVHVLNATAGGRLEVFPRVDFASLLRTS